MHPATRRFIRSVALWGGALAVGGTFLGCMLVDRVAFPGAATQGRADARLAPGAAGELVHLRTASGTGVTALFGPALDREGRALDDAARRPTLLFFYGNGACVAHMAEVFQRLRRLGVHVIMPDYPGYGMSEGKASERGCFAAADAVLAWVAARPGLDRRRVIAGGWSMGGAVALDLAAREPLAGVFTINTFTSGRAFGRVAVSPLVALVPLNPFDSIAKIPRVRCPILIAHGARDTLIPPRMADELAAAATSPVTRVTLEHSGHNDVFQTGGEMLWGALEAFVAQAAVR
jgi:pimeloyl-ACP methyl ester carboxylesterase